MIHECPIDGCQVECDAGRLMCGSHWRICPRALQRRVWRAWTALQEAGTPDRAREYRDARQAAVDAVNAFLGGW